MKIFGFFLSLLFASITCHSQSWIRVNQLGYLPNDIKNAVLISDTGQISSQFSLYDALTGKLVFSSENVKAYTDVLGFEKACRLDFSAFTQPGAYYIKLGDTRSPNFRIDYDVYKGTADFLLNYMRQQRCGYNPFLNDSCHVHDGYIIYHPTLDSTHINVTGGWHDASDYLQYVTTSANAVFQLLLAYEQNPGAFSDKYDANGNKGANDIPDILDEAKWGLDWLVRMNPEPEMMFNQIADDRDHAGFRLPNHDSVNYGKGLERPVYFVTGKPQGLYKYQNRTTGVASTAGKFASAFAMGAEILRKYYPDFASEIAQKAESAFDFGLKYPGACQTAPCGAPYFYEEDNWTDDMELAAVQLYRLTDRDGYLKKAESFAKKEPITPWMGADTAKHYQWYPFFNVGHYYLGQEENQKAIAFYQEGLEKVRKRVGNSPFLNGIPFIWCSNNLTTALITQSSLYRKLSKDKSFLGMETALRDWLFGCNPWGTSMVVGLPTWGDSPTHAHSSFTILNNYPINGGLVDGPVYGSIYNSLKGIRLMEEDEYADFQSAKVVYHDDYGDYSTNEPTMDGTASLTYYLSYLEKKGKSKNPLKNISYDKQGAIVRLDSTQKNIYLIFSAHDLNEGGSFIAKTLQEKQAKASFFFTGDFYRNAENRSLIENLKTAGHYLGGHSDKHLLYADWEKRDSLLVDKATFTADLQANYQAMQAFGIDKQNARWFLPPYEWYNKKTTTWAKNLGVKPINYTPGTGTARDYTWPEMGKRYAPNKEILDDLLKGEAQHGLNGTLILIHLGTDIRRKEKFYHELGRLIDNLQQKGYEFKRL